MLNLLKVDVSAEFLKQMQSLEATANEYLRQFWSQIYPPPEGAVRLSPEERGKKIGAMRDQLVRVQKQAPELVHRAATNRWDSAKVEEVRSTDLVFSCAKNCRHSNH
jgi:transcription initiation factor TFIIH subunit 1